MMEKMYAEVQAKYTIDMLLTLRRQAWEAAWLVSR